MIEQQLTVTANTERMKVAYKEVRKFVTVKFLQDHKET